MGKEITQDYLKYLFDYKDGNLYWDKSRGKAKIGNIAGYTRKDRYKAIQINGKMYLAHRLIFLYHQGYLPKSIDHIDGDPSNNKINNLREATNKENSRNQKKTEFYNGKQTSSIYKGVYWNKLEEKWVAQIIIDGKHKHLGYFDIELDAANAYDKFATNEFGKFAKLNNQTKRFIKDEVN